MPLNALVDIIRSNVEERPDNRAVTYEGVSQTFAELDRRSSRVANALIAAGVGPQDRVAYLDKNVPAYFEVAFGALKVNAVLVGVNWRLAGPEVAHILADSGATVLFVGDEFAELVAGISEELPALETIVANDGNRFQAMEAWIDGHPDTDPNVTTNGGDVATQLYTSGTTGHPKGVMLSNDNLSTIINNVASQWRMEPGSVSMAAMPMFHIGGSGWAFVSMAFGAEVVLVRDIDPTALIDLVGAHHITHAFLVPAVLQFMLMMPNLATADVSSLELVVYGASPITETVLTQSIEAFGCDFMQVYGLTETTGAITQLNPEAHRPELLRSCGAAYPWVELRCVDSAGDDVPAGTVGEIWTRSDQNMLGYWNNPEATAEAINPEGWFKTGDAGYLDDEGNLFIHDRVKDMIVSGGENIYPAEIENVLSQHPSVADVGVIGVPDDKWGETVKAVVVARPGTEIDEAELIAFARQRLAGFKLPRSVDLVDELPRNPTGKILKKDLR
ncbi:MAG: long-chain-fatty-acid--CoA ligase, partial [Acidimicrobiia bacterium]|nr:long-chain-fatty-acid--CoA ligase [Acidimicrobiia bacterium]